MKHPELDNKPVELKVIAREPFKIHYDGVAQSVIAENEVGEFSILPGHADFFSMLIPCEVTIITDKETVSFNVNNGIATAQHDEVLLFVNM